MKTIKKNIWILLELSCPTSVNESIICTRPLSNMFQNIDSELGQRLIKFAAKLIFFSKYWSEVNEIFYNSTLQTLIVSLPFLSF